MIVFSPSPNALGLTPVYTGALPFGADFVQRETPPLSDTEVVFNYRVGGIGGTIVTSIKVTYVDAQRDEVLYVETL